MQVLTKAVSSYFNSQPREGGWSAPIGRPPASIDFNSQPREGGWTICLVLEAPFKYFNSQPREGGWFDGFNTFCFLLISTHSRAKAAGG